VGLVDQLIACFKEMPGYYLERVWRYTASLHEPLEVGEPHYAWCMTCRGPWPCKAWIQATDEVALLTKGSGS
jgi:hypothetical protein